MIVVLVQPEIPPNTGNIIRLCANTGCDLHLIAPLGFSLEDRLLRRAGLDYHERTSLTVHDSIDAAAKALPGRWIAYSSHANNHYSSISYRSDDVLVFGAESAGLDASVLAQFPPENIATIPMRPNNRSLNLGNAVAVVVYEAWRQHDFDGAGSSPVAGTGLLPRRLLRNPSTSN